MPKGGNDPIQEQLIAARREQILNAATQVFAEKGFHRATIKDVAQAAGVADGTIYNYFQNKTALLMGLMDRLNESDTRDADLSAVQSIPMEDFTRGYLKHRFDVLESGLQVFQVVISELLVNPELRDLYNQQIVQPSYALAEKHFQALVDAGQMKSTDIQVTMRLISGMAVGMLFLRILGDPVVEAEWQALPEILTDFMLHGLSKNKDER